MIETLVRKALPQRPEIEVLVPNYKEPILPVNHGGFGWFGLQAYNEQGQLMCHECGGFFDGLCNHIKGHGLGKKEYKKKYGLRLKARLASVSYSAMARKRLLSNPDAIANATVRIKSHRPSEANRLAGMAYSRSCAEFQNNRDSCPAQVLRALSGCADIFGSSVTSAQVQAHNPALLALCVARFGSFNKAKQLAGLASNPNVTQPQYHQTLVTEDMIAFHAKHNRWPESRDYETGQMVCSTAPLRRLGGLRRIREQAIQEFGLREGRNQRVSAATQKIEMELAGTARR